MAALIEASRLSRRYTFGPTAVDALVDVELRIAAGEAVAIVGPSGSGKSTLLNLIGGLDRPTAGTLEVDGRDLAALSSDELARYRRATVGFVFQAFRLLADLTASENVALPLLLAGGARAAAERRAGELLARVGLADRATHRPPQLSAGEQQRVAVARALANGPRLLLADEPTGNLDAAASAALLDLVASLRASEDLTVIVATHDPEVAARADRVVRLRSGRLEHGSAAR
jgi:putative ABC transport system ATP-binding protein